MKTLESRFRRPDSIALAELERLRALPRLTDSPRDICAFACGVSNATPTLKALNRDRNLFRSETTKTMLEKLTPSLHYRWFDYINTQRDGARTRTGDASDLPPAQSRLLDNRQNEYH